MKVSTHELLLALRAPSSGWLAALVCALDEAMQDPDFSEHHRSLVRGLLDADAIPSPVSLAAAERLVKFEESVHDLQTLLPPEPVPQDSFAGTRPKLTICGGIG